ncbi:hypothetical protein IUJ34_12800 [Klebsiella pneumoniae subsp. pneumoniae]|uniref:Uncharacterized protein n=1 Tax=Klebsiella pneumoniae subsp. pneumoniae TaxID=72407 RepID=A0A7S9HEF2_KLEPN|nr:hypothetical protein IUJ34_12800 [Klebsiella pneumoniae subsp. pneumoniae]
MLQELGYKRNVALTVPGFEQSLLWPLSRSTPCWPPRRATVSTIISSTSCRSSPGRSPGGAASGKAARSFTLLWHKRNSYNPKLVWLRDTLKALYSGTL